jgi:hypothetical protein
MLKYSFGFTGKLFHSKRRRNHLKYWTDIYPSPESSWIARKVNYAGNWVYSIVDNFFSGSQPGFRDDMILAANQPPDIDPSSFEWELHQGIADIAARDIQDSLGWIIPGFIRKYTSRIYQLSLLYFFTDVIYEEFPVDGIEADIKPQQSTSSHSKIIYELKGIKARLDSKCLSVKVWYRHFISKAKMLILFENHRKTYYLLGNFAPQEYGFSANDHWHTPGRADKVKLKPAFIFHKRI